MRATKILKQYGFDVVHAQASIKHQDDSTLTVFRQNRHYELTLIGDSAYLARMAETIVKKLKKLDVDVSLRYFA